VPTERGVIRHSPRTMVAIAVALSLLAADQARPAVSEEDLLIELLELTPGEIVADVGAGDGRWTETLSRVVGADGRVFATEVEPDLVAELKAGVESQGLGNVTVLLGTQDDTGLAANCCDAILLRMVYHHFQSPDRMRESLYRSLRPGGLLAVIDIRPQRHWRQLEKVPDRGGHGIEPEALIRELAPTGFELVSVTESWSGDDNRYCALFRRGSRDE
jgi:predicted methyltransferase